MGSYYFCMNKYAHRKRSVIDRFKFPKLSYEVAMLHMLT